MRLIAALPTRRMFLSCCTALASYGFSAKIQAKNNSHYVFGAIRWDAQYCDTPGQPCFEEEKSLGNHKWQFRAPLHSTIVGADQIRFTPTQKTFDAEIEAASSAGLKYWAYLMYGKNGQIDFDNSMLQGLAFHRASLIKSRINYAIIATVDTLGRSDSLIPAADAIVSLMKDINYQTVLKGRPVIYIYYLERILISHWGSMGHFSNAVRSLRLQAITSGLQNPYIIVLAAPPEKADAVRLSIGADAISSYAVTLPNIGQATTYNELADFVRNYWQAQVAVTSADVVPTIMIGWDDRPRKEIPPFFDQRRYSAAQLTAHVAGPTPKEFATQCQSAKSFLDDHPKQCASGLALIYAWNEDSEGGPLEPTLGNPDAPLLKAIASILK